MMTLRSFKSWEKLFILFSIGLIVVAAFFEWSGVPLFNYLFEIEDGSAVTQVGSLTVASGKVRRQISTEGQFKTVLPGNPIFNLDVVVTDADGGASISFDNGSALELEPNTMIKVAFPTQSGLTGIDRPTQVSVVSGSVSGKAGKRTMVLKTRNKKIELKATSNPTEAGPVIKLIAAPKPIFKAPPIIPPKAVAIDTQIAGTSPTQLAPVTAIVRNDPTREQLELTRLLSPTPSDKLEVDFEKNKITDTIELKWQIWQPKGQFFLKVFKTELGKNRKIVFQQAIKENRGEVIKISNKASLQGYDEVTQWSDKFIPQTPGDYRWEIQSSDGKLLTAPERSQSTFKVLPKLYPLLPPERVTPTEDETFFWNKATQQKKILISWKRARDATEYKLEVSTDTTFKHPSIQAKTRSLKYTLVNLETGNYYWRVQSLNRYSTSPMSKIEQFNISDLPFEE